MPARNNCSPRYNCRAYELSSSFAGDTLESVVLRLSWMTSLTSRGRLAVFPAAPWPDNTARVGGPIELRVAQGHTDGPVSHQLFDHLQRRSCIEQWRSKRMPQRVWRVRLRDV